jgi:hypothetical protein
MTEPDPIDELAARLFQAARQEPLPEQGLERALRAARAEVRSARTKPALLSRPARWTLCAAAVALAAAIALFLRSKEPLEPISAEPASSLVHGHNTGAPSLPTATPTTATPTTASETPRAKPAPVSSAPTSAPAHSAHAEPASLSDELSALKRASSALNAGDTHGALTALDQYDHVLKGTKMRAEATLLRIETLARAGQAGAASELAQRFVAQNPESPLVDRARSFVQQ